MTDRSKTKLILLILLAVGLFLSLMVCCGLAALLIPVSLKAAREEARREATERNLAEVGEALRSFDENHPSELAPASDSVACVAVLTDYEEEFPWFESGTEAGETGQDDGVSPRARFLIREPRSFAGREVWIVFKHDGDRLPAPPTDVELGTLYRFSLPGPFLASQADSIDNSAIEDFTQESR